MLNLLLPSTPLCNISSPTSCCHLPTPDSSHRQKESTLAISSTELQQSPPQVCAHSDCVAISLERKVVRSPSKRQSLQTLANTGTGKQRNGPSISHIGYRFPQNDTPRKSLKISRAKRISQSFDVHIFLILVIFSCSYSVATFFFFLFFTTRITTRLRNEFP